MVRSSGWWPPPSRRALCFVSASRGSMNRRQVLCLGGAATGQAVGPAMGKLPQWRAHQFNPLFLLPWVHTGCGTSAADGAGASASLAGSRGGWHRVSGCRQQHA